MSESATAYARDLLQVVENLMKEFGMTWQEAVLEVMEYEYEWNHPRDFGDMKGESVIVLIPGGKKKEEREEK